MLLSIEDIEGEQGDHYIKSDLRMRTNDLTEEGNQKWNEKARDII